MSYLEVTKVDLLNELKNNDGYLDITSISSIEEGEGIIGLAKQLEHEGHLVLIEYCMEKKPLTVSLKTKILQ